MSKKALLIGINYNDSPNAKLDGCINDVINMRNILIDAYGYNAENIVLLRDDISDANFKPTTQNILNNLVSIVSQSARLGEIWIHYSGHGSRVRDTNGDEVDALDEIIVPSDYLSAGVITDDKIFNIVSKSRCRTMLVFDSCNSGTVCDLMWNFNVNAQKQIVSSKTNNNGVTNPNIVCLSGCRDEQSSADIYSTFTQQYCGAMTSALIECLRWNRHNVDIKKLFVDIVLFMTQNNFTQIPQLSSSAKLPVYQITRDLTRGFVAANYGTTSSTVRNAMKNILSGR
jgi:hypothetical protein